MHSLDIIEPKDEVASAVITVYGYFSGGPVSSSAGTTTPPYHSLNPMNPKPPSASDLCAKNAKTTSEKPDIFQLAIGSGEFGHSIGEFRRSVGKMYQAAGIVSEQVQVVSRIPGFWDGEGEGYPGGASRSISMLRRTRADPGSDLVAHVESRMCFVLLPPRALVPAPLGVIRTAAAPSQSPLNREAALLAGVPSEEEKITAMDSLEHWLSADEVTLEQLVEYSMRQQRLASAEAATVADMKLTSNSPHRPRGSKALSPPGALTAGIAVSSAVADDTAVVAVAGTELRLLLVPMMNMPAPSIRVTIASITKVVDGIVLLNINNKSYIQYQIVVRQGRLEWVIARRFSDFSKLHAALVAQDKSEAGAIPHGEVPPLPLKYISNKFISMSDTVVQYRKRELQVFVNRLLDFNKREANHHILRFLGLMNNSNGRDEAISGRSDSESGRRQQRSTIHISKLQGTVRWGDIILFKCKNSMSSLQRTITGSDWDHIGVVVAKGGSYCGGSGSSASHASLSAAPYYNNYNISELYLMESTIQGVTVFPLIPRLNAYHNTKFCDAIGLRCYYGTRTLEMYNSMVSFVASVNGAPYGLKLSQVLFSSDNAHPATGMSPSSVPPIGGALARPQSRSPPNSIGDENEGDNTSTSSNSLNGNVLTRILSRMSCSSMDEDALINSTGPTPTSSCLSASSIVDSINTHSNAHGTSTANSAANGDTSAGATSTSEGYFCSELVAAFLIAIHFIPSHHNPAFFWPDSFAQGKYMDTCISQYSDRKNEQSLDVVAVEDDDLEADDFGNGEQYSFSYERRDSSNGSDWEGSEAVNPISGGQRTTTGNGLSRHSTSSAAAVAAATAAAGIGYYGDEFLLDCEVIEVAKAKLLASSADSLQFAPRSNHAHSSSAGSEGITERRSVGSATSSGMGRATVGASPTSADSGAGAGEDDAEAVGDAVTPEDMCAAPTATFVPTLM